MEALQTQPSVSIVVPCYNEEKRLQLDQFKKFLSHYSSARILFVNDGSSDDTFKMLTNFAVDHKSQVEVLNLRQNVGKAEAVRLGIVEAAQKHTSEWIAYWDADLAVPIADILYFFDYYSLNQSHADMILGSRIQRMGSDIRRLWWRHYLGRVFATLTSLILGIRIYDTQCGAKLIRRNLCAKLFSASFLSSWIFDVEVIARFLLLHSTPSPNSLPNSLEGKLLEVPLLSWSEVGGSKLRLSHYLRAPLELSKIWQVYGKKLALLQLAAKPKS